MVDTDALAAEMLAGLEGATPGEWAINERHSNKIVWMPLGERAPRWWPLCETIHERDAAHIHATRPTAIRAILAERDAMKAELARLREALNGCDWYWPEDDTSSDACADGPWQIAENHYLKPGEVIGYLRGGVVDARFYGFLEPADDAGSDDNFEVDEPTRQAAEEKISAELSRRAALKGADHD